MNALTTQPEAPLAFTSAYRQLRNVERAFVDKYIERLERDADRAGENISMMLYKPIPQEVVDGSRGLLDKPMVRAAITERINQIASANELSASRVVKEMMSLGFSNMGNYVKFDDETGNPYFDLSSATPEQMAAVKSIKLKESGDGHSRPIKREFEFVLHDKIQPLHKLAEYMGITEPDNPHWRAQSKKPAGVMKPGETAGDRYAAMIGD